MKLMMALCFSLKPLELACTASLLNLCRSFSNNSITFYPIVNLVGGIEIEDSTNFFGQLGAGLSFAASLGDNNL